MKTGAKGSTRKRKKGAAEVVRAEPEEVVAAKTRMAELLAEVAQLEATLSRNHPEEVDEFDRIYADTEAMRRAPVRPMPDLALNLAASPIPIDRIDLERAVLLVEASSEPGDSAPKVGVRASVEWTQTGISVYAEAFGNLTRNSCSVTCSIGMRLHATQPPGIDDRGMLEFAKSGGFRALVPYIRSEMASLTAKTAAGTLLMSPLIVSLEEAWEVKRRELLNQLDAE